MRPKDAGRIANSADAHQTDLGPHCLPRPVHLKLWIITVHMGDKNKQSHVI